MTTQLNETKNPSILPFNSEKINNKYLVTNVLGCWDTLTEDEFRRFHSLRVPPNGSLFNRLVERGLIADEANIKRLINEYRQIHANLFTDTSLHIAVLTKKCNLRCTYCHAEGGAASDDMSLETASRVLQYLFDVRNNSVTLEFQGGEPLMNWPVVKFLTEHARKFNTLGKKLNIAIVTNMLLLDDEKMRFFVDHDVDVCTSVDGPQDIHDKNRINVGGRGTYAEVIKKIEEYSKKYGRKVHMLPTITRHSLAHPERIIDEYIRLGSQEIALRPVNKIGYACNCWDDVGYTAEEFNEFYSRAMKYLITVNASGKHISERMARIILTQVLLKKDHGYVDMMSPSGAGRSVMAYAPDGGCYPTDEARMLGDDIFRLGDINKESYSDMLNKENLLYLLSAGYSDLWNYRSVFSPWMGVDPVVNYAVEKNVIIKGNSRLQKVFSHQFRTVFSYLLNDDQKYKEVFQRWTQGAPDEKQKKQ
ncbi:MAG: His-Xaa-Ser system radical SAM maturase HxsB [Candidatus Omnitrophica bacterium]|nr:His-Xaa-Ser system radical SAM maturase HxsB [Candidatus Omnitrophota bacterium]